MSYNETVLEIDDVIDGISTSKNAILCQKKEESEKKSHMNNEISFICADDQFCNELDGESGNKPNYCKMPRSVDSKNFKISCLNVRSLYPKVEEIRKFVKTYNFDIFIANETWLDESFSDRDVEIPNYDVIRRDRNRQGGGVCIYVKSDMKYNVLNGYGVDLESVWISIVIDVDKFVIGTIYRPPSAVKNYDEKILDVLEKLTVANDHVILLGDLNVDCLQRNMSNTNFIKSLSDLFQMTQLVEEATRETLTCASLLDVILTTSPSFHSKTSVLKTSMSDHYCVHTELKKELKLSTKHKLVTFRNFKKFDRNLFLKDVETAINELSNYNGNLQELWNKFKRNFIEISDRHAPMVTHRLKDRKNPWITHEIVQLMYQRDHVKQKAVKFKCQTKWKSYRKLRNQITTLIRTEKNKYWLQQTKQCVNNPKNVWKVLNKVITSKNMIPPPNDMSADELNEYFCTIGENTANYYFDRCNDKLYPWKGPDFTSNVFGFTEVQLDTVLKLLKGLGDFSSSDVLDFDGKLLYLSAEIISPFITKLFNMSLSSGIVIDDWKISRVTPAFKGGNDRHEKSNYRPISVIGHISKILEKVVQMQIVQYLSDNELLCIDQSAYRKFHNTQTSLHRCNEDWIDNICDNLFTAVCFLDIRKCFDTIDHDILLDKLKRYGIIDVEATWFKSYLKDRSQYVKCNGQVSTKSYVPIGVPQGSVLGPILFSLFINDINCHVYPSAVNLYADDTLLYTTGNTCAEASEKLQTSINEISKWYRGNRLALNESKSKCMLLSSKHKSKCNSSRMCVSINDIAIEQVDNVKYLGVTIDQNLTWNEHVSLLCRSLAFKISHLRRIKRMVSTQMLTTVYNSIIQPTIDYAITVWGHTTAENLGKIQRLQNLAARIILNNFDYVNSRGIDLVKQLKWMNVSERFLYFEKLLIFKCIYGMVPDYLENGIMMDIELRDVNTRSHDMNVYIPFPTNELAKRSLYYSGAKNWNSLPSYIKESTSIEVFKKNLKRNIYMTSS